MVLITLWTKIKRDGHDAVRMYCPLCKQGATLDHDVAEDGTVRPSVDCPNDDCDFHEHVKLDGWIYGALPHTPTLEELEDVFRADDDDQEVEIQPDGSVHTAEPGSVKDAEPEVSAIEDVVDNPGIE